MLMSLEVLLKQERSKKDYQENAKAIYFNVKGLKRLTSTLLDLARIEQTQDINYHYFSVNEFLNYLSEKWQSRALEKKITLVNHLDANNIFLRSNYELLIIAVGNFIENAIKYSSPGSTIDLSAIKNDDLKIIVEDRGVGMDDNDLASLGDVFFRSNSLPSEDMSYGLGFAQAKKIVKLLGGELSVGSTLGQGTKVVVSFNI